MGRTTIFSIDSEGDQMTPIDVHRTTPNVIIGNKSEAHNLNLKFNPRKSKEKTDKQQCLVCQEYKDSKMQFTLQEGYVPQYQVQNTSAI